MIEIESQTVSEYIYYYSELRVKYGGFTVVYSLIS